MHNTQLINKITEEVQILSKTNCFNKVNKLLVCVNADSHVNETNLYDSLRHANKKLFGNWTEIQVEQDDIPEQVAILKSIEGEKSAK
jgi:Zn finger protein HypA/HybF involved in hydrogenase expression